ncbi:hypothetical protein ACFVR2_18825 [Gottfriedia sp. NPDC057991]|uniref:hypothetical protein n=1 Tax=Gottfriedia sp. NPDC057991 TaxID=3346298 RepID=UPI0036DCFA8B
MLDLVTVSNWKNEQYNNHKKIYKDPRREKLLEYRKGFKSVHYDKEVKEVRKDDYRKYRNRMNHLIRIEKYELIHKYKKTSGWLTW